MIISGALIAPFAITVLPVKTYIQYSTSLNFQQPVLENWKLGPYLRFTPINSDRKRWWPRWHEFTTDYLLNYVRKLRSSHNTDGLG
jgi:hypothetical protein